MSLPAPWLESLWVRLAPRIEAGAMAHALLIAGPSGVGKWAFAWHLAGALLCESRTAGVEACGQCRSCNLLEAGSHPDLKVVEPDEDKTDISVAQIREVVERSTLTRHLNGYRNFIIRPADRITVEGANALLKTLEEPPSGTVFTLVTSRPAGLLATIRSRCQLLRVGLPGEDIARDWLTRELPDLSADPTALLDAARGAPYLAVELANNDGLAARARVDDTLRGLLSRRADPLEVAREWSKLPVDQLLYWMQLRITDVIRRTLSGESRLEPMRLYCILDAVTEATRLYARRGNPNHQLMLETLALTWAGQNEE